jgi:PAS domain S-box-containing protein
MPPEDRVNILIVDDQSAKLASYETVLSELGETLIRAGSARQALAQLLKNEVAVILVDVCMPELDGFQLAEMIRDHPRYKNTAIVFISAIQLDEFDRLRGYQLGAVDYVPVPIIPELLRAKVEVFAELYRKTRQLERLNRELELRVAERTVDLEATNARLRLAIDVARLGTWGWNPDTGEIECSEQQCALLGYQSGEIEPSMRAVYQRLHPDDRARVAAELRRSKESGSPYHQVFRCIHPDGSTVWCDARGQSEGNSTDKPRRILGITMDISEHKLAEERQRLMLQELHHRVKNCLAAVQAIASLTARTAIGINTFIASFSRRIQSLSRTHTMLVNNNWQCIGIRDLLISELGTFDNGNADRLSLNGHPIELPSSIALSIGLAIHELTTNAVKHGSLSVPNGRVDIAWDLVGDGAGGRGLKLDWIERGGPPVARPRSRGFGSSLLPKIFDNQPGSTAELKFDIEGLQFHAIIPFFGPTALRRHAIFADGANQVRPRPR